MNRLIRIKQVVVLTEFKFTIREPFTKLQQHIGDFWFISSLLFNCKQPQ